MLAAIDGFKSFKHFNIFSGDVSANQNSNKCIAIAKCDLFFHYHDAEEISFYNFATQIFVQNTKNTHEFHLHCWDHVYKVNEWCLADCFHCKFRVSTPIMACDYCIAKYKKFSACGKLLMVLWPTFS